MPHATLQRITNQWQLLISENNWGQLVLSTNIAAEPCKITSAPSAIKTYSLARIGWSTTFSFWAQLCITTLGVTRQTIASWKTTRWRKDVRATVNGRGKGNKQFCNLFTESIPTCFPYRSVSLSLYLRFLKQNAHRLTITANMKLNKFSNY